MKIQMMKKECNKFKIFVDIIFVRRLQGQDWHALAL